MGQIDTPVFIIGPGRSGTTLLLRLMSLHPDLAWFSGWTNAFPQWPQLSLVSRINDAAFLEEKTRNWRRWPRPAEAYDIWNYCFPGFSSADQDWGPEQASLHGADQLERIVRQHLTWQGKPRFLTKYTGWPRIHFLRAVFSNARFVYIDRDPRAVVYSYHKQNWWRKKAQKRNLEERIEFYASRYLGFFQSKKKYSPGRDYIQVHYEKFIHDPVQTLDWIFQQCNLDLSRVDHARITSWGIKNNTNNEWVQNLPASLVASLSLWLEEPLTEMGYQR